MDVTLFGRGYRIASRSITGRREMNQDRCAWVATSSGTVVGEFMDRPLDPEPTDRPDMLMAVVCDGMGGMDHGEYASETVCEELADWARSTTQTTAEGLRASFLEALVEAERTVHANRPRSGTTMTAIIAVDGVWTSANLGDSRCYRITGEDVWRTRDDSPVEDMFRRGEISEDEMNTSPISNLMDMYVGGGDAGDTAFRDLGDGWDRLALCSDGAFGYMPVADFRELIRTSPTPDAVVQEAYARGSTDNATVLTVDAIRRRPGTVAAT